MGLNKGLLQPGFDGDVVAGGAGGGVYGEPG